MVYNFPSKFLPFDWAWAKHTFHSRVLNKMKNGSILRKQPSLLLEDKPTPHQYSSHNRLLLETEIFSSNDTMNSKRNVVSERLSVEEERAVLMGCFSKQKLDGECSGSGHRRRSQYLPTGWGIRVCFVRGTWAMCRLLRNNITVSNYTEENVAIYKTLNRRN